MAFSFFTASNGKLARQMVQILQEAGQAVPPELQQYAMTSGGPSSECFSACLASWLARAGGGGEGGWGGGNGRGGAQGLGEWMSGWLAGRGVAEGLLPSPLPLSPCAALC